MYAEITKTVFTLQFYKFAYTSFSNPKGPTQDIFVLIGLDCIKG